MDGQDHSRAMLLAQTRAETWQARRSAVVELAAHAGWPEVLDRMVELFGDEDLSVVAAAATALVVHGGDNGLDAVLALLEDGPQDAGYAVRDALVELVHQDPRSAAAIRDRLGAHPPRRAASPELLVELALTRPTAP